MSRLSGCIRRVEGQTPGSTAGSRRPAAPRGRKGTDAGTSASPLSVRFIHGPNGVENPATQPCGEGNPDGSNEPHWLRTAPLVWAGGAPAKRECPEQALARREGRPLGSPRPGERHMARGDQRGSPLEGRRRRKRRRRLKCPGTCPGTSPALTPIVRQRGQHGSAAQVRGRQFREVVHPRDGLVG